MSMKRSRASKAKKSARSAKTEVANLSPTAAPPEAELAPREGTRSAETFIAAPVEAPFNAGGADDMAEYLGEIFVDGGGHRNDVALDMETLQPVVPVQTPAVALGPAVSAGQVRDLVAEFEDAPTLPEAPRYRGGTDLSQAPDVHVAARFADLDEAAGPRVRVSGR
jgi:hypothetical protein